MVKCRSIPSSGNTVVDMFWSWTAALYYWLQDHGLEINPLYTLIFIFFLIILMIFNLRAIYKTWNTDIEWPLPFQTGAHPDHLPKYEAKRPLGQLEYIMLKQHEKESGIISAAFMMTFERPTTDKQIKQALFNVARCQPLLKMKIVKNRKTGVPYFEPIQNFQVDYVRNNSIKWNECVCNELERKFNIKQGPLWRAIFFPDVEYDYVENKTFQKTGEDGMMTDGILVLSFHRVIMEEASISDVGLQFMWHLNIILAQNLVIDSKMGGYLLPLLPSLDVNFTAQDIDQRWYNVMGEKITNNNVNNNQARMHNFNTMRPSGRPSLIRHVSVDPDLRHPLSQSMVCHWLDDWLITALSDKCEKYVISLYAAVEVATVLAYTHLIANKKEDVYPLVVDQVVHLKGMLPAIPYEYLGNYSVENTLESAIPTDPQHIKQFWNIARSVSDAMMNTVKKAKPVVDADSVTETSPVPQNKLNRIRLSSLGNLPIIDWPNENPLVNINAIYGHAGLKRDGALLSHTVTGVYDGFCSTVTYSKDHFTRKQMNEFIRKIVYFLKRSLDYKMSEKKSVDGESSEQEMEYTLAY